MTRGPSLKLFGIADLHLPHGPLWALSEQQWSGAQHAWTRDLRDDSILLLAGDQIDASAGQHAEASYAAIAALPGTKVVIPGNHDLRCSPTGKALRRLCAAHGDIVTLMGSAARIDLPDRSYGLVVAGTTGHRLPGNPTPLRRGRAGYQTELRRLESALSEAAALRRERDALAVLLHYPPCLRGDPQRSAVCQMIRAAGADVCVYGHVHDAALWPHLFQGSFGRTRYRFVACDYLRGHLRQLGSLDRRRLRVHD